MVLKDLNLQVAYASLSFGLLRPECLGVLHNYYFIFMLILDLNLDEFNNET